MNKVSIVYADNGKVLMLTDIPAKDVTYTGRHAGVVDFDCRELPRADDLMVVGGRVVEKPVQPSPHHVFDYAAQQWIDPRAPETEWPLVRAKRDRLIAATDWTQLPDVPLATKEMWANYRQALRDVTLQADPFNIVWPVAP